MHIGFVFEEKLVIIKFFCGYLSFLESISDRNKSLFIKICRMFEKDSIKFIS